MDRSSKNLIIGQGEVWFSPYKPGTQIGTGFEFLGNCPSFTMTVALEKKDHYGSMGGKRKKDASVTIQKTATGTLTCDDVRAENVARYIGAAVTTLTQTSGTASTAAIAEAMPGRRYQIGVSAALPTGVRNVSNVTVEDSVPTTYTEGVDYTVDLELGMIDILEGGTIVEGTALTVTYDNDASSRVTMATSDDDIEGEIKFLSYNATGPDTDYFMPWGKLTPNGEFNLISEDFLTIPFNIEALSRNGQALIYGDGRPVTA